MPRTTPDLVKGIIEVDDSISLDPFIAVANSLVTELCAPGISDTGRLEMIERYLSAHFYAAGNLDQISQMEAAGSVRSIYQGKTDMFLSYTPYGQTACLLDSTGSLTRINKQLPRKVSLLWVGTNPGRGVL